MPTGIYKRTKIHPNSLKNLTSRFKKGHKKPTNAYSFPVGHTTNVGKKLSEEHRQKVIKTLSTEFRFKKGMISYMKGKKHSKETKKQISKSLEGNIPWNKGLPTIKQPTFGKKWKVKDSSRMGLEKGTHNSIKTEFKRGQNNGEKNHNYKGGITPENAKIRSSFEYRKWIKDIFNRDNFTCQKTKVKGGKLVAHHILNFSSYPELRLDLNNGITLSKKSHEEFHQKYGVKNNTREQLLEFINE